MTLDELIADVKAITSNVLAGNIASAVKAGGMLLSGLGEWLSIVGFQATADHDAKCAEFELALSECHAACTAVAADAQGKIFPGDGSFLKMLVELLMKFAPLFIKKPPVAA